MTSAVPMTAGIQTRVLFTLLPLLVVFSQAVGQYKLTYLVETPIQKSEKETTKFLATVAAGKQPAVQFDGRYRSYSLEAPFSHIEYKIAADTCVMVGVRFAQPNGMYEATAKEILLSTKPYGDNRLKETGSKKLIYVLNPAGKSITVISYDFALRTLKWKPL